METMVIMVIAGMIIAEAVEIVVSVVAAVTGIADRVVAETATVAVAEGDAKRAA